MIDLEKHIKEQRLLLDSDSPKEGHEQRFLHKLGGQSIKPVRRIRFRHAIQVAASLAIILTSAIVLIRQHGSGDRMAAGEIPPSMLEADIYYASQVNDRYEQIHAFNFNNTEEKTVLLDELKDLDAYHQQLMSDLEANPDDGRVINALIRHYQIKLEVMDQIIIQLNQIKTETSENYENESI